MAANCTSAAMRKKTGMSKKVACDFMHADKGKHFKEFKENLDAIAQKHLAEADDPFASWQGMDLQRKHYNKDSMHIIDKALELTANAKDAHERLDILKKYAAEVGVDFSTLYYEITQDTGAGYFNKDDYTQGTEFQRPTRESSEIMKSYKAAIKKM